MSRFVCTKMMLPAALCLLSFSENTIAQAVNVSGYDLHGFRESEAEKASFLHGLRFFEDPEKLAQQRKYDVTYYGIDITVLPVSQTISGSVLIKAVSLSDSLETVILDLDGALTVSEVTGNVFGYSHNTIAGQLSVFLDTVYSSGKAIELTVNYYGRPVRAGFSSFSWTIQSDGNYLITTLSEPYFARTWWPSKDIPEDKADSADIAVTIPSGLTAVSNGSLESVRDNGDGTRTFVWHERYPIATYLISLAVSNYDHTVEYFTFGAVDSMPVEYYVTPLHSSAAFSSSSGFHETIQMLRVFSSLFGPYPFLDEKYAQVEFAWSGGMEHQTATSIGFGSNGPSTLLVAHELAHQWWGDLVTCRDWRHLWLNEGFATYAEGLYLESTGGKEALQEYMNSIDRLKRYGIPFSGRVYRDNLSNISDMFNATVYDKGAWVLHMLRNVVGDSTFFDILKKFAAEPELKYGTATTEDFQAVCESVYGESLDWFFSQWIYGYGRPFYMTSWSTVQESDSFIVNVDITQMQAEQYQTLFTMPVDLFVYGQSTTDTFTIINDSEHQQYTFTVATPPVNITFDEGNKILKSVQVFSGIEDKITKPEDYYLKQNFPNPFNSGTFIAYNIDRPSVIRLSIFSTDGSEIRVLESKPKPAGIHYTYWDGRNSIGIPVVTGLYFYRLTAGEITVTKRMLLIR